MKKLCYATVLLLLAVLPVQAQLLARISVKSGKYRRVNAPLYTGMQNAVFTSMDSLQFFEVVGGQRKPVPFQLATGRCLRWTLEGVTAPGTTRVFELIKGAAVSNKVAYMQTMDSAGTLLLKEGNQNRLRYNYSIVEPPDGVDKVYRRSGFIHPLWAPDGQVLTNIHPEGHWHHVGIWTPWTHTMFKGKETDFWNLQKKEGTVRFKALIGRAQGPVMSGFDAVLDHIAFTGGKETVAMNEEISVSMYNSGTDPSRYTWDLLIALNCADTAGITLLQYRYGGGFAMRATAAWTAANSQVLTSEGKTRVNADSTRARWIKMTGRTDKGQTGILIMSNPANYDYPQPLRVWPENSERGEIMMNFSPTKMKPWQLNYGMSYHEYYRVVTFNNDLTLAEIEEAWNAWVYPPTINVSWNEGI